MNIVLDTNIIIRYPEILGISMKGITFFIPQDVLTKLRQRKASASLSQLVEKRQNTRYNIQSNNQNPKEPVKTTIGKTLDFMDFQILQFAKFINENHQNTYFASDDKFLVLNAKNNGIKTLSLSDLKTKLSKSKKVNETISKEIDNLNLTNNRKLITGIVIGVIVTSLAFTAYLNLNLIVDTINTWGTILLIVVSAIALFIFREKQRLAYGIAEFLAGFIAVLLLFPDHFDYSQIDLNMNYGLKLFGSLYIMVRGQDNILKSISGTKIGAFIENKIGNKTDYNTVYSK